MNIVQFLRILWARRLVIVAAVIGCAIGAAIVVLVVPPRWDGHARVMLDLIKPDPVTGVVIGANSRAYANTQIELIKDYSVAGKVVDQLGWLSDPTLIERFQQRSPGDTADFRRWLAQIVIDRTQVKLLEGSNILEITYAANRAEDARTVADALMKAYIDTSVGFRREEAARNADWFDSQALQAKTALDHASLAEADFERKNNIVLSDDKTDVDSARLHALAGQAGAGVAMFAPGAVSSPSSGELAQLDASIALASQTLGPNHPELVQLRARRAALATQVAQERSQAMASARAAAGAAGAQSGELERAVAAQKAKVVGESDKLEALRQLQSEVDLRREQYAKTAARAAELRQEANVAETGLTVLSAAVTPDKPTFPNNPLIAGGAVALGLGMGAAVALLMEMFGRKVRSAEDLESAAGAQLLTVVPEGPRPPRQSRAGLRMPRLGARRGRPAANAQPARV